MKTLIHVTQFFLLHFTCAIFVFQIQFFMLSKWDSSSFKLWKREIHTHTQMVFYSIFFSIFGYKRFHVIKQWGIVLWVWFAHFMLILTRSSSFFSSSSSVCSNFRQKRWETGSWWNVSIFIYVKRWTTTTYFSITHSYSVFVFNCWFE